MKELNLKQIEQLDSMEVDVLIVGAGPAGLSAAIKLAQLSKDWPEPLSIWVLEKGAAVGAHILSGACFDPIALRSLFPDLANMDCPLGCEVQSDEFLYLTKQKHTSIPEALLPYTLTNQDCHITSMGKLCQWLGQQAESAGIEILPATVGQQLIIEQGKVTGVVTGELALNKSGKPKSNYQAAIAIKAKFTLLAEGARGHLGKQATEAFGLDRHKASQHFALGFKEVWRVPKSVHQLGKVTHTLGYPLANASGGGFIYHADNQEIWLGLVVDLNFKQPNFSPYDAFQAYKHHPALKPLLENSERISYGARCINKSGNSGLLTMVFNGGFLLGCDAGTLDTARIKGNHTAMQSGILAAQTISHSILNQITEFNKVRRHFNQQLHNDWLYDAMVKGRYFVDTIHRFGNVLGGGINTMNLNLFSGSIKTSAKSHTKDHETSAPSQCKKYKKFTYDNKISFDRNSSVFLTNTHHEDDQPCHLKIKDNKLLQKSIVPHYQAPAQSYCPAGVYSLEQQDGQATLSIQPQNCIHCKCCDIKEPFNNIEWTPPQGGSGPNYQGM